MVFGCCEEYIYYCVKYTPANPVAHMTQFKRPTDVAALSIEVHIHSKHSASAYTASEMEQFRLFESTAGEARTPHTCSQLFTIIIFLVAFVFASPLFIFVSLQLLKFLLRSKE